MASKKCEGEFFLGGINFVKYIIDPGEIPTKTLIILVNQNILFHAQYAY